MQIDNYIAGLRHSSQLDALTAGVIYEPLNSDLPSQAEYTENNGSWMAANLANTHLNCSVTTQPFSVRILELELLRHYSTIFRVLEFSCQACFECAQSCNYMILSGLYNGNSQSPRVELLPEEASAL